MRSWYDVPAAASSDKLVPRFSRGAGVPALAVAGTRRSTRTCCARAMPRRLRSAYELLNGTAPARGLSPSVHARSATRQAWLPTPSAKPAPRVTRRAGAPELAVTRKEGQHSSQLCARPCRSGRGRLVSCGSPCANERPLSFVTRSWCDVQAAVFNAKLAQRASRGTGAPALTVTGDEAQHSSLLRARAMRRWL